MKRMDIKKDKERCNKKKGVFYVCPFMSKAIEEEAITPVLYANDWEHIMKEILIGFATATKHSVRLLKSCPYCQSHLQTTISREHCDKKH